MRWENQKYACCW